ncbi:hypothetical protein D3C87_782690 [compost metagenome]
MKHFQNRRVRSHVSPTAPSSSNVYVLTVRDNAMAPRYRAGELIFVTPGIKARVGHDVVVTLTDGRRLVRRLGRIESGQVRLLGVCDDATTVVPRTTVVSIHRIGGSASPDLPCMGWGADIGGEPGRPQ